MQDKLNQVLPAPVKHDSIPLESQWLAGEGAGSWFNICFKNDFYFIIRYSPKGEVECESFFEILEDKIFNINDPYQFTYLSHCKQVRILQNDIVIIFNRIK